MGTSPRAELKTSESTIDPRLAELDTTDELVSDYAVQIQQMLGENRLLHTEKDDLDIETVDLNKELLQLDLKVAAMESEARKNVETVIVYNFVDAAPVESVATYLYEDRPDDSGTEQYEETIAYDNYERAHSVSYGSDDFVAPEHYYDPSEQGMDDDLEQFGTPFFN